MATNPAEEYAYPFSTRDADSIPLEIIDPERLIWITSAGFSSPATLTLPANFLLGHVYATQDCIIKFNTADAVVAENTVYNDTLLVPGRTVLTVKFTVGPLKIIPCDAISTRVYFQEIRKWNTLGLKQQLRVK